MAKKEKIYVLDTSVLLHDHQSISTFEDNNVAIPITVLEELDKFKVGNDTKNCPTRFKQTSFKRKQCNYLARRH